MPLLLHRTMHKRAARLTGNRGSVPAAPDTPMTISWRRFQRDQRRELSRSLALDPSHRPTVRRLDSASIAPVDYGAVKTMNCPS